MTHAPKHDHFNFASLAGRYVHCRRPRCPKCRATSLRSYKTLRSGDGSVTRYTACKDCGHRFILVLE
jgi:DNA-directed RNA polymerase subunit M/transcription elongation factor TFIIS